MNNKCIAVILSAGRGKRMGGSIQKQYMDLCGKPVLFYTLKAFEESEVIDQVILVTGKDELNEVRTAIVDAYGFRKVTQIVEGGKERYDSVFHALQWIQSTQEPGEEFYLMIHDGARPFVDEGILRRLYEEVKRSKACVAGMPVKDTIKIVNENLEAEEKRQLYLDIYHDAAWLTDLVENLLYATRIEEGRMKLKTSAELVSDIVESAILHIGRKAEGYHLTVNCEDELLLVRADGRLVEQVLVNLVDNALKYTEPGSSIAITARKSGSMALIQVSDDGPGIPDEAKKHLFDLFYTAEQGRSDCQRGLGLGLNLCRSIIAQHNGQITVSDNRPSGTVFRFTLPAVDRRSLE